MKASFYCYVTKWGEVRFLKNASKPKAGEVEFRLHIEIPDGNFKLPPAPEVYVVIPGFIPVEATVSATVEVIE